jgi:aspartate carbamoyltransferase catalytic subunit
VPEEIAGWSDRPVVNAGDGINEHPTQALLDAVTIKKRFGRLDGLRMAIVGDIAHSRVANSLMKAMPTLGVDLILVGPSDWLPTDTTAPTTDAIDDVLAGVDVLYLLRVQTERGGEITERFVSEFGIDRSRAGRLRGEAVVMHPGPINRGVEISEDVADGPRSLILEQVANGVPSRMAVLEAILVPG